ncbi:protein of unknown function [Serratia sp. Tan611]|nr:protein of unknown function [Serratia sp. Tan611]
MDFLLFGAYAAGLPDISAAGLGFRLAVFVID